MQDEFYFTGSPVINTYYTDDLPAMQIERWKNGDVVINMGPKDAIKFTRVEWEIFALKFRQIHAHMGVVD